MYFESRSDAGAKLAGEILDVYRGSDSAVVALNDGGVLVGEQIAWRLHCVLMMLVSEGVSIPGEGIDFGAVSQTGQMSVSSQLTSGQAQYYIEEFHGYLQEEKRRAHQRINRLLGDKGIVDRDMLRGRTILLVSDGFSEDLSSIDVALDFFKSIRIERLVVLAPVASIAAIDRLHVAVDELHILDVKSNYISTDHYYDSNFLPDREDIVTKINQTILNWQLF